MKGDKMANGQQKKGGLGGKKRDEENYCSQLRVHHAKKEGMKNR